MADKNENVEQLDKASFNVLSYCQMMEAGDENVHQIITIGNG